MGFFNLRQGTKRWHAHRANLIGGSEIGVLAGYRENHSHSKFSLWHEKAGTVAPRPYGGNKRTEAGLAFEEPTAKWVAKKRGWKIIRGRCVTDDSVAVDVKGVTKGMGASLDFEILDAGQDAEGVDQQGDVLLGHPAPLVGPGSLSIKAITYDIWKSKWKANEPPESMLLQLQHELACTGYKWGVVVVLLGINDYRLYFYDASPTIGEYCRKLTRAFWEDVAAGKEPTADDVSGCEADTYTISKLFPYREGKTLDMTGNNQWPVLCAGLSEATQTRLAAKKEEDRLSDQIKALMAGASYAKGGGWEVKTTPVSGSEGRPAKAGEIIGARKGYVKYTPREAA